jgi:hypothetical protein
VSLLVWQASFRGQLVFVVGLLRRQIDLVAGLSLWSACLGGQLVFRSASSCGLGGQLVFSRLLLWLPETLPQASGANGLIDLWDFLKKIWLNFGFAVAMTKSKLSG